MRARPALKMRGKSKVRYAYAITAALLLGGTAIAVTSHNPVGAQTAQNEGPAMQAVAPRGAPTSFANMVERLPPAVVHISTRQHVEVQNPFAGTTFVRRRSEEPLVGKTCVSTVIYLGVQVHKKKN